MGKYIHERLREWANDAAPIERAKRELHVNISVFCSIADEIECFYMPLPCDENGKPWKVGDLCIAKGARCKIAGFDGGEFINVEKLDSHIFFWCDKRYVKRTAPAYDADGVEIEVGEKRWSLEYGTEYDVLDIKPDGSFVKCGCPYKSQRGDDLFTWLAADQLTKNQPVLDFNKERICEDDIVWCRLLNTVDGDKRFKVIEVQSAKEAMDTCPHVIVVGDDGEERTFYPESLTHKEPDSYEKLRDAMKLSPSNEVRVYADRLTDLIERGA